MTPAETKTVAAAQNLLATARAKYQASIDAGVLAIKAVEGAQRELAKLGAGVVPAPPPPAVDTLALFNNGRPANGAAWFGASLGSGINGAGWPDFAKDVKPLIDLGVKTIRFPFKREFCFMADGSLNAWVVNKIVEVSKKCATAGVAAVWDDHNYAYFGDPSVAESWIKLAPALEKALGGPSPMFGIELQNEPGKGSKDLTLWTDPLRTTIKAIREAGYQGYIFAGAPDWNNMTFLPKALESVTIPIDPLNRTIFTGHDYWNKDNDPGKCRNDMGTAVDGNIDMAKRYGPAIDVARKLGVKIVMSELGGGIAPDGPLPAYNGIGKDGQQLQEEYYTFAKANEDVLIGTWFWMAGKVTATYRHKIEAGNPHTKSLQTFW